MDMEITHVIRGDDHLNNTPRQINILNALGSEVPHYAHVPMILGEDGKRLSKRHGAVNILDFRDRGYLPEALLNYLVRLGWSHGDQEIFSLDEMIKLFSIEEVNKSAAAVNPEKLLWLNQHYMKQAEDSRLADLTAEFLQAEGINVNNGPELEVLVAVQKERTKTVRELAEQSRCFYVDFAEFDQDAAKKHLRPVILEPLRALRDKLAGLDDWQEGSLHKMVMDVVDQFDIKLGKIAQPLRVAVTGTAISPSIDTTLRLLGKEKTLSRLDKALSFIEQRAS